MSDQPKTTLTDGSPVTSDHKNLKPNGQQKGYVVLSTEERAKGWVRPLRTSYVHRGSRPKHSTRPLTPEEELRYKDSGYILYEEYPKSEAPKAGMFWTKKRLESGCGATTTMSVEIAETYARDPKFYGGTFCTSCGEHFPLDQFVWDEIDFEQVGS